jgi:hypothetical protein
MDGGTERVCHVCPPFWVWAQTLPALPMTHPVSGFTNAVTSVVAAGFMDTGVPALQV